MGGGGGEGRRLVFKPEHGSTHPGDSLQINRSARLAAPPLPRSKAGRENVSESKRFLCTVNKGTATSPSPGQLQTEMRNTIDDIFGCCFGYTIEKTCSRNINSTSPACAPSYSRRVKQNMSIVTEPAARCSLSETTCQRMPQPPPHRRRESARNADGNVQKNIAVRKRSRSLT